MDRYPDMDALRRAVEDECFAAAFGGGIGPAMLDALDARNAGAQELVELAERWGIDPEDYID